MNRWNHFFVNTWIFTMILMWCVVLPVRNASAEHQPPDSKPLIIGHTFEIYSQVLEESRGITVHLPDDYDEHEYLRYPVVIVLDTEWNFTSVVGAANMLTGDYFMPECIIVGVKNTTRFRDFTPPNSNGANTNRDNGRSDLLRRFITDELVPHIDSEYRTHPFRVLIGHSLGGLFAHYAMATAPDYFAIVIALDPSLIWNNGQVQTAFIQMLRSHPTFKGRLVSIEGTGSDGWHGELDLLENAKPETMTFRYIEHHERHLSMPHKSIFDGLKAGFAGYETEMRADSGKSTLKDIESQYAALSDEFGYPIDIPLGVYRGGSNRQIGVGNASEAALILEAALVQYPDITKLYDDLKQVQERSVTAEKYLSSTRTEATPTEFAPLIGTWEGIFKQKQGIDSRVTITFAVDGEHVVSESIIHMPIDGSRPPMTRKTLRHRKIDGAYEWEGANRSGGFMVNVARLIDKDTLAGHVELRGFTLPEDLVLPEGMSLKDIGIRFELKKIALATPRDAHAP
jgi:hypothetical protein